MMLGLFLVPFGVGLLVWVLRKARLLAAPLSAAACMVVAVLAMSSSGAAPIVILGRPFSLPATSAAHLALLALLMAAAFLYAYALPQGSLVWPLGLVALGFWAAALMATSAVVAGLLFLGGALSAAMLVPSPHGEAAMIGSRTLTLLVLGGILLLMAAQGAEALAAGRSAGLPPEGVAFILTLALALLTGLFPFSLWFPQVAGEGAPVAVIVLGAMMSTTALLRFGDPSFLVAPLGQVQMADLLRILGMGTFGGACLAAAAQRRLGRLLAYAALADWGLILVGVSLRQGAAIDAAMLHLAFHNIALATAALASGLLRRSFGEDALSSLYGAARRAPFALLSAVAGGLSLAGMPAMAGFWGRLGLYRLLADRFSGWAAALALLSLGPAWGFVRLLIHGLEPAPLPGSRREMIAPAILVLLLGALLIGVGLAPQVLNWVPGEWLQMLTYRPPVP